MDLQGLISTLLAGRRLILIATFSALIGSAIVIALDEERYRAESLLALTRPESTLEFDERFGAPDTNPAFPYRVGSLRTYPELAMSDGVIQTVLERLPQEIVKGWEIDDLRQRAEVEVLAEGSLLSIRARGASPEAAATIAEAWASVLSQRSSEVFGGAGEIEAVVAARDQAAQELDGVSESIETFYAEGGVASAEAEVTALRLGLDRRHSMRDRFGAAMQDASALRERVGEGSIAGARAALSALQLELATLTSSEGQPGMALEMAPGAAGPPPTSQELTRLLEGLDLGHATLSATIERLEDELALAHAELSRAQSELKRLEGERDLAQERWRTLGRKVDELRVVAATTRPELRSASVAVASDTLPIGAYLRQFIAAGLIGFIAGAILVLWNER